MVIRFIFWLLLLSAMPSMAATKLEASVDKNPVLVGEFFMLNISADATIRNEQPDTSALLKDFVVGPTSLTSRTNIINGSINKQTTWSIKLMTRSPGDYTIPSFSVAGLTSQPIHLKVSERETSTDKNNDIFVKASLSSHSLFVQEAGVYTVKLYLAKELLDGSLSTPSMEDAQLTQLGKQTENYELVNGKRYLVITREYLIQPQKSGTYSVPGPVFQGRVQQNYRPVEVSALGDEQQIEVKPIPNNYQGAWLPSELVNLNEQWQPEDNTIEVGTPITRTITLTALGVTKEQLPDIAMPTIDGIRSYPDEKENNNAVRDGRVVSQQTASYALLPQKAGTYTLPEIKLPWYNTKMNRISYATLPKRTITVIPSSTAINQPSINNGQNTISNATAQNSNENTIGPHTVQIKNQTPLWLIAIAVLGYILWLATLIFYKAKRITKAKSVPINTKNVMRPNLKTLSLIAKKQNIKAFYDELNNYAVLCTHKKVGALNELCLLVNSDALNNHIVQLQAQLYSSKTTDTDLNAIVKILEQYHVQKSNSQAAVLKDLYS